MQDFPYPETRGEPPADLEQALQFNQALLRVAARDPAVHKLWQEVAHMLKPGTVLTDPDLVSRVRAEMATTTAV